MTFFRSLTAQEARVLAFVLKGLRSGEIAATLAISKMTINTHRRNVMTKWHDACLNSETGKRAAREMLAIIRPYATSYLPPV